MYVGIVYVLCVYVCMYVLCMYMCILCMFVYVCVCMYYMCIYVCTYVCNKGVFSSIQRSNENLDD
jgi:hypothetical protein